MAGEDQQSYEVSPRRLRSASKLATFADCYAEDIKLVFQDSSPLLIASLASLAELNRRLQKQGHSPISIERFRPNLVIDGSRAFEEDWWSTLKLQGAGLGEGLPLQVAKSCHRCIVTTKPQAAGRAEEASWPAAPEKMRLEPLKTLKKYRLRLGGTDVRFQASPCFAINVSMQYPQEAANAVVRVGDLLCVERYAKESLLKAKSVPGALE